LKENRPECDQTAPATTRKRNSAVHHPHSYRLGPQQIVLPLLLIMCAIGAPDLAMAQSSPFLTGATALQTNILSWLTPIAIILVMILGGMAMANRMSWGWCIGAILGIAIGFGAPQIVTWVRGLFGV
jgi:type IV secretion system protein VirB2